MKTGQDEPDGGTPRETGGRKPGGSDSRSDRILAAVLDHTPMLAAYLDRRFNFIWVNRAYADAGKMAPADFSGLNHFDLYPDAENQAIFQRVVDTGKPVFIAAKAFTHPGQPERGVTWWDYSLTPVKDDAGAVTGMAIFGQDITADRNAATRLMQQNDLLAAIGRAQDLFISGHDHRQVYQQMLGILVKATASACGFLDEVVTDPSGKRFKRSLALSDVSWDTDSRRLHDELKAKDLQFRCLDNLAGAPVIEGRTIIANDARQDPRFKGLPQGHPAIDRFMGIPLVFGGELIGVAGVANRAADYTDAIAEFIRPLTQTCAAMIRAGRLERSHIETEDRFRKMFLNAPMPYQSLDEEGRFLDVNQAFLDVLGYTREELIGRSFGDILHPDWADHFKENFPRFKAVGEILGVEFKMVKKDGATIIVFFNGKIQRDAENRFQRTHCIFQDITARKQSEETLRMTAEMLDSAPGAITVHDAKGRFLFANRRTFEIHGYTADEFMAINLHALDVPESRALLAERVRRIEETGEASFEVGHFRKDGSIVPLQVLAKKVTWAGKPAILSVAMDLTERKEAEAEREKLHTQLLEAQKMESVGRLAGGVAHEFNNMMGVVLGHTELVLEEMQPGQPMAESLRAIQTAAERSANLTRQLLAFARKQTVVPKVLDMNDTVERMLQMMRRIIGEDIDLEWLPAALWPVRIDPGQIDQVLANLCANAREAISGTGRLRIETGTRIVTPADSAESPDVTPGEYVTLAVSDDGCGMDRQTLANIFEPFFTTREVGQGSGLGLPTVYGIVRQNGGFITVTSAPGRGSTFLIHLPRYEAPPAAAPRQDPAPAGGETILLVEDEPAILDVGRRMLERLGYRVLTAATPSRALDLAGEHGGAIDLVMSDVVMPEMNGRDLVDRLRERLPRIKALFMSGYTADVIAHHGVLGPGTHFIQKPFTRQELAPRVREALSS